MGILGHLSETCYLNWTKHCIVNCYEWNTNSLESLSVMKIKRIDIFRRGNHRENVYVEKVPKAIYASRKMYSVQKFDNILMFYFKSGICK